MQGDTRTATISYIGRNYVGFRKVTLKTRWEIESPPEVEVAASDTTSLCLSLSTDAFVKWEDMVWTTNSPLYLTLLTLST